MSKASFYGIPLRPRKAHAPRRRPASAPLPAPTRYMLTYPRRRLRRIAPAKVPELK